MVQTAPKPKRQRSCIACGKQDSKGSLLRVVRNADGSVSFDPAGRAPGRGAYVCSAECFAAARKTGKLDRALRVRLSDQDLERIAGQLPQSSGRGDDTE